MRYQIIQPQVRRRLGLVNLQLVRKLGRLFFCRFDFGPRALTYGDLNQVLVPAASDARIFIQQMISGSAHVRVRRERQRFQTSYPVLPRKTTAPS